jgi:hypothetical protein
MRRLCAVIFLVGTFVPVSPGLAAQIAAANQPYPDPGQQAPPPARPSQTPAPTPPDQPAGPPSAPYLPGANPSNVKLELTITDTYTGTPIKKTVSMLILNGRSGMIRTSNRLATGPEVGLNVDAAAMIHQGGLITVRLTFEYTPAQGTVIPTSGTTEQMNAARSQLAEKGLSFGSQPAQLHESISVILQDGKPLLVSQSADPTTDRKVTVELTATVLK